MSPNQETKEAKNRLLKKLENFFDVNVELMNDEKKGKQAWLYKC